MRLTYPGHLILFATALLPGERPADLRIHQQPATVSANRQTAHSAPARHRSQGTGNSTGSSSLIRQRQPNREEAPVLRRTPAAASHFLLALAEAPAADRKPGDPVEPPAPPVLILNLSAPAGAAESVGLGDMATVTIDGKSTAQGIVWAIVPTPANANNWRPHVPSDPAHASQADYFADLCNGTAAGTFTVIASGNLNGQTVIAQQVVTFGPLPTPPPPTPTPPPDPGPKPNPPPTPPVAAKLWILTIDDYTSRSQATADLLSDGAFWRSVSVAGHKFREYDTSDPSMAPWLAAAKGAGVSPPVVIFQDQATGKLLEIDSLPSSTAGIAAAIANLTGKAVGK